jgi:iron complex outermembrane receptor protein
MSIRVAAGAAAFCVCASSFSTVIMAASAADTGLEEIIVTAQRREESVQNIGIAISVLAGGSLAEKSITHINDIQNATPSLQVEPAFGSGQPQFRLRGIGFIDYTSNNTSPVGVSLDGVAFALPIQTQGQLFDLDRIEVLRGPQGTLYGRNTTGGEINFVSNRPTADTHAGASVEYGSHNLVNAEAFVSGAVAPDLLGRVAVATEQGGAWQRDRTNGLSLGDQDKVAVRGQLQWDPAEFVKFRLGLHWAQDKSDEQGLYLLQPFSAGATGPIVPADSSRYVTGWNLNPTFGKLIGLAAGSKPGLNNSNSGVDLTGDVDFGFAKLTSITAYNKLIRREYGDWDATDYDDSDEFLNSDLNVFSEELRLASNGQGPLNWVIGGIYSNEDLHEDFYSDLTNRLGGIALTTYEQTANSVGVFAQGNYQFSDQWKLTLGAREDHESRELIGLNTSFVGVIPSFTGAQGRAAESNLPSGKFELDYKPLTGTLLYASVSRGVKSGGFTAHNTLAAAQVDPFFPEKLTAYEIGVKSELARTVRINASTYYYRYRDQQILTKAFDATSQSYIGIFTNANARISGAELSLDWLPVTGLTISQYAGFVEGYYTSPLFDGNATPGHPLGADYDGRPESIPKWSYGGDAQYALPVGNFKVTTELNYSFHDTYSQFFLLGSDDFTVPKYWLANANLSVSPESGAPWTVGLWGRNIFNRSYDLTRNFFLPTSEVAAAGEPATFGVRFSYKY